MKRLTLKFVREKFAERDYILLSDNYINAHQKLKFRCDKGHIHAMTYGNFKNGARCIFCFRKYNADSCRMDYSVIKESFERENYQLLTLATEYKNSNQKLKYICPVGHKHSICWSAWKTGNRCAVCAGQVLRPIEEVRESFEAAGYALLDTKYENWEQKLRFICPKGHKGTIGWGSWSRGSRCQLCFRENSKNKFGDIKKAFESKGYTLLSTKYKNAYSHLDYICPEGHHHSMAWNNFQQGTNCPTCAIKTIKRKLKKSIEDIRESFRKEGYTLLTTEYENSAQKLKFKCPRGHLHEICWGSWSQGTRCMECYLEDKNGSTNPNWKGGIAVTPYCPIFKNKEWRKMIYDRDKDKFCWNPLCEGKGKRESLHHIDYIKENCEPANIIKVCNSCNSLANADRDWWQAFYTEIMERRSI